MIEPECANKLKTITNFYDILLKQAVVAFTIFRQNVLVNSCSFTKVSDTSAIENVMENNTGNARFTTRTNAQLL